MREKYTQILHCPTNIPIHLDGGLRFTRVFSFYLIDEQRNIIRKIRTSNTDEEVGVPIVVSCANFLSVGVNRHTFSWRGGLPKSSLGFDQKVISSRKIHHQKHIDRPIV